MKFRSVTNQNPFEKHKMESLRGMAMGVAHDFNNLLAAISGNNNLVLHHMTEDAPGSDNARQVDAIANQALELTNKMLIYTGKANLNEQVFDLSSLVHDMRSTLNGFVTDGINIEFEIQKQTPLIKGDVELIRKVIINLVENASDSIASDTGNIVVRTGFTDLDLDELNESSVTDNPSEGTYACVEVSDSGYGIPPAVKSRIFDPFFTTKIRAPGLGLSTVYGVMRAHKGAIKVDSVPCKGSTFKVFFPCIK